jgi:hypothetical protein
VGIGIGTWYFLGSGGFRPPVDWVDEGATAQGRGLGVTTGGVIIEYVGRGCPFLSPSARLPLVERPI